MKISDSYSALIIDNNPSSSKIFSSMVKNNFNMEEIYTSTSAQAALAVAKNVKKMDWIFCDSSLPDRDCFKLLDELKSIKSTQKSNYILISSSSDRELLMRASSSGVHEFILKPFTQKTVLSKLSRLVNGKSLRKNKRIMMLNAFDAMIDFSGVEYKSSLVDISLGGCMLSSDIFNKGGGFIYDTAGINIQFENEQLELTGELIRIERDSASNENKIHSAFLFNQLDKNKLLSLNKFIEKIKA